MRKFFLFIAALCCAVMANAAGTMLLDSMITENSSGNKTKLVYTYDERGNQLTQEEYRWTTATPEWVGMSRYEFTYDANDSLLTKIRYNWNTEYNTWDNSGKDEYTYGENGAIQTIISYEWNAGAWSKEKKTEYTYDVQGHLKIVQTYFHIESWYSESTTEYTYNSDGYLRLSVISLHGDYSSQYEYTYTDGNLTQRICSVWNPGWSLYSKEEWTTIRTETSCWRPFVDGIKRSACGMIYIKKRNTRMMPMEIY